MQRIDEIIEEKKRELEALRKEQERAAFESLNAPKGKSMADYVTRKKVESSILSAESKVAEEKGLHIDNLIVEYLHLKQHASDVAKEKNELEKRLDAMVIDLEGEKLVGNKYTYEFTVSTYDKIVSKKEVLDAGLLEEFKKRGFIKLGTRKTRVVGEK